MKPCTNLKWDHLLLKNSGWYRKHGLSRYMCAGFFISNDKIAPQMPCFQTGWLEVVILAVFVSWHPVIRLRLCHSVSRGPSHAQWLKHWYYDTLKNNKSLLWNSSLMATDFPKIFSSNHCMHQGLKFQRIM